MVANIFDKSSNEWVEVLNIYRSKGDDDIPSADEIWGETRLEKPDYCWTAYNTNKPLETVAIYPTELEALRTANELNYYSDERWVVKRVRFGFDLADELVSDD